MAVMPLIRERLHFLTEAPEMVKFLFVEPAVPSKEEIVPKKLDLPAVLHNLEEVIPIIEKMETMSDEECEAAFRAKAEELGVKMGDVMMPIRMAVTGSRVSPPLVGSIKILGCNKAVERIRKTLAALK